ncbi:MAG: hypothetical protein A2X94_12510 [Bdellovibrionales bacterium GWB1_55_8]|nr:MAG: hypothetical protein A2X94_12510 [Bdellovibrionales bacterium GWB1_55_8]
MLKLIGLGIKLTVLGTIFLVLGNVLEWRGKTISDQVKVQIAQAERSQLFHRVRKISSELSEDSRLGQKQAHKFGRKNNSGVRSTEEDIPVSERQKLKSLIRELNSSSD